MGVSQIETLISEYFAAFNAHDAERMFATLSPDVIHVINEGPTEVGIGAFRKFKAHMDNCYLEHISDLFIMVKENRGTAEFTCSGTYLKTDGPLLEARGQTYAIPAAAIFECDGNLITRITSYYSLKGWLEAVA